MYEDLDNPDAVILRLKASLACRAKEEDLKRRSAKARKKRQASKPEGRTEGIRKKRTDYTPQEWAEWISERDKRAAAVRREKARQDRPSREDRMELRKSAIIEKDGRVTTRISEEHAGRVLESQPERLASILSVTGEDKSATEVKALIDALKELS